ncbi:MAG: hypothetical protein PHG67_07635 [Bacteroidales bacterium]|jgi:hypothetical protein|nr:hypothetical protein [Bacteroidales bacterium]HOI32536.1 hypothetical protein [Bacteroidales bacterium]
MKTTGIITAIIFQLVSVNLISAQWQFSGHANIEAYVDDIPFNTAEVVKNYYDSAVNLQKADPEAFVDDIPFNTTKVVATYKAEQAMNVRFTMKEEAGIQDIPFNTAEVSRNFEAKKSAIFGYERISK